jgi:multicomponent Na+:H+ antiporter subunit B
MAGIRSGRRRKEVRIVRHGVIILLSLLVCLVLIHALGGNDEWPLDLRNRITASGEEDTGASNLVAAVYLGYRALDTLGETIVLLLAVSGLLFIIKEKE